MPVCANCNNHFEEHYCNRCGQKKTHRITLSHLWHDLLHAFTHTDHGFFYMMGQLFIRPGVVAREYILEGKRKKYFMPLQYLVILAAITAFVAVNSHFIEQTAATVNAKVNTNMSARQAKMMARITLLQAKYFNFLVLLQLPFFALSGFLLYRKKYRINYAEALTLQTFVSAQLTIFTLLVMLATYFLKLPVLVSLMANMLIGVSFHAFTYTQFFQQANARGVVKAMCSFALGIIFFMLMMVMMGIIIGIVFQFSGKM